MPAELTQPDEAPEARALRVLDNMPSKLAERPEVQGCALFSFRRCEAGGLADHSRFLKMAKARCTCTVQCAWLLCASCT